MTTAAAAAAATTSASSSEEGVSSTNDTFFLVVVSVPKDNNLERFMSVFCFEVFKILFMNSGFLFIIASTDEREEAE